MSASHEASGPGGVDPGVAARVEGLPWPAVERALDEDGWAVLPALLTPAECEHYAGLYVRDELFRKRVIMSRHGFGSGEYQYFAYPLPGPLAALRAHLYGRLVGTANRWSERMGVEARYPLEHAAYVEHCRTLGQDQATPLLLRYGEGDYNCLHQDLYGEELFPLQVAVLLSRPRVDFEGGEIVVTEQRPRAQSRPSVIPLGQGDAAVFAVQKRPVSGRRGYHRVNMRHGVSRLRRGHRHVLGIIFHDAA